jgi:hypothetical protein
MMHKMFLSQSEIATWARCPRKWLLEYYFGMVPADELPYGHRILGVRVHIALDGHYGWGMSPLAILQVLYAIEIREHPEFEQELKDEMALALIMVSGYLEWAEQEGADSDLQVVATETDLQVPLPGLPEVILRARMDQVVRQLSTGALKFLDHKTSASFSSHQALERNPQFRFYGLMQFLAAGHGVPVPGMELRPDRPVVLGGIINTLRRSRRSGASKPPYYARDEVRFSIEVLESTYTRTAQVAREIQHGRAVLDQAYAQGGELQRVNAIQRSAFRPNPIDGDCDWRCPAASGLCVAMDDGSDWPGILDGSGRFVRADPYARYSDDPLRSIREKIPSP